MGKIFKYLFWVGLGVSLVVFLTGCPEGIGPETPTNLAIQSAEDGASVKLTWDAVEDVDGYIIYFNDTVLDTTKNTEYTHSNPEATGEYAVSSYIGDEESDKSASVSDKPKITPTVQVYEIGVPNQNSGFGWSTLTGEGTTYSMADASHAGEIDLYFTNWAVGYAGNYDIASPSEVLNDAGASWLAGTSGWRTTGIVELTEKFDDVKTLPSSGYDNYQTNIVQGGAYGVFTQDGYYGMVEIKSVSPTNGLVEIRTAFQKVKGLRVIAP